jgi:hypothetical protein
MVDDSQKREEEQRRERHWDPLQRWNAIQATISWAEAQGTVQRNTKAARLAEQNQKLGRTP